jgi:hypothetical protein
MKMRAVKSTCTTLFLLPALGLNADELNPSLGFIDGFTSDKDRPTSLSHPVFALFRPADIREFQEFVEAEYGSNRALKEDYDYDGGFVVLLYQYPAQFQADYRKIENGKYSRVSPSFSETFPQFEKPDSWSNPNIPQMSLQRMVYFRAPALVSFLEDAVGQPIGRECWGIPDKDRETLDIKRIRDKEGGH